MIALRTLILFYSMGWQTLTFCLNFYKILSGPLFKGQLPHKSLTTDRNH